MRLETATYKLIGIGPGGRRCPCCAPPAPILKRLEHKAARRSERKQIKEELNQQND